MEVLKKIGIFFLLYLNSSILILGILQTKILYITENIFPKKKNRFRLHIEFQILEVYIYIYSTLEFLYRFSHSIQGCIDIKQYFIFLYT